MTLIETWSSPPVGLQRAVLEIVTVLRVTPRANPQDPILNESDPQQVLSLVSGPSRTDSFG